MNTYTVSFFGHRRLNRMGEIEQRLEEIILRLIEEKSYVEFLVGREGDFDRLVASVVCRCKRIYGTVNSALVLVLPYLTEEFKAAESYLRSYYDEIEVCHQSERVHFKAAYQRRNRAMVDRSDVVVFFVERDCGGAYQTMQYAVRAKIDYVNLAELMQ